MQVCGLSLSTDEQDLALLYLATVQALAVSIITLPYWFICYHSNYIRTLHTLYCFQYGGPSLELKRGGCLEEGNKHHLQFTVSSNLQNVIQNAVYVIGIQLTLHLFY